MKTFIDICKMTQKELKEYLVKYLRSKGYAPIVGDGYIYAPPKEDKMVTSVLLIAHMDTVHHERIKEVQKIPVLVQGNEDVETRISSPQGIGGDDRCGIWAIMNLVNEHNCHVLFTEDEETGGVGARNFSKTELCKAVAKQIDYMIEIDRRGNNDAVFYSCDNKDFTEWITSNTTFKKAEGSFTDISVLMPVMEIAGVNFSSGYYNAHTLNEYVVEEELEDIIERISTLLTVEIPSTFKYIRKTYSYGSYNSYGYYSGYGSYRQRSLYDDYEDDDLYFSKPKSYYSKSSSSRKKPKSLLSQAISDTKVKLIVISSEAEELYGTDELSATGDTKPEAWMNLFMEWSDLSFSMIENYEYE